MPKSKPRKRKTPKRVLALPDLEYGRTGSDPVLLGPVSIQTTERYLGCKQKLRIAVNDRLGIEPDAA
jgi:hypothetical protein